jgi:signal transduction histidine kinase
MRPAAGSWIIDRRKAGEAFVSPMSDQQTEQALRARVLAEQVRLMSKFTTSPLFGSIFLGAMLVWLCAHEHGFAAAFSWYALLMSVTFIRWRIARAYLRHPHPDSSVRKFRTTMLTMAAVAGAVWSMSGTLLLPSDSLREVIVAVFFIGATASGMGSQAPVPYAYACLLVPFMLPYAINQMLMGQERIVLGIALLLYIPIMLIIARRQTISFEQQIRLAFENESLVDALRRERDLTARINQELQAQIEEQRSATHRIGALNRRLQMQATELQAANKDLEGFSYSVSHDLRGPLRAIDGFSNLLQEHGQLHADPQAVHCLTRIRDNIARMSALIDDLLEFARCGRQTLHREDLDMESLVREVYLEIRSAYPHVEIEFVVEPLPGARGDTALIRQVWLNFLDNAVKYSTRVTRPLVTVTGRESHDHAIFEISDNGVGFDARYGDTIFQVFQRLHGSEYPGTGVGLAIVQRIVNRHGGEVWARSTLGQGSTFGFSLPLHELTASGTSVDAVAIDEVE